MKKKPEGKVARFCTAASTFGRALLNDRNATPWGCRAAWRTSGLVSGRNVETILARNMTSKSKVVVRMQGRDGWRRA